VQQRALADLAERVPLSYAEAFETARNG